MGLDVGVDGFFDEFVPGEGGNEAEAAGAKNDHLFDDSEWKITGVIGDLDFFTHRI